MKRILLTLAFSAVALMAQAQFKVLIDAGHGGKDPGAATEQGLAESKFTLDMALRLQKILKAMGMEADLTRSGDDFVSLEERVANSANYSLLISLHADAGNSASGTWALMVATEGPTKEISKEWATRILPMLKGSGLPFASLVESNIYILKNAQCPALYFGIGNMEDKNAAVFTDPQLQERTVQAIAKCVMVLSSSR